MLTYAATVESRVFFLKEEAQSYHELSISLVGNFLKKN